MEKEVWLIWIIDDFGRPRTHGNLIFHYGELPLGNLEKYDRKTNILAPDKNKMEVFYGVYEYICWRNKFFSGCTSIFAEETKNTLIMFQTTVIFFYKSTEGNTTIRNIYVKLPLVLGTVLSFLDLSLFSPHNWCHVKRRLAFWMGHPLGNWS